MGQCCECQHFSCRGDEYIANCAICRNRSRFVARDNGTNPQPQQPQSNYYNQNMNNNYEMNNMNNLRNNIPPTYRQRDSQIPQMSQMPQIAQTQQMQNFATNQNNNLEAEITLRDRIAMVVLQNPAINVLYSDPKQIAKICYDIADAILEQRQQ